MGSARRLAELGLVPALAKELSNQSLIGDFRTASRLLRIVPTGDSIDQGGSVLNNGNWQYTSNYIETAIYLAGPRFQLVSNAGVAGETSSQILARFQTDVLSKKPDVVTIKAGTNNLVPGQTTAQLAAMMSDIERMVAMTLDAGALPVVVTPPAKDSAKAEARRAIPYYYRLAQAYGVPLADMFKVTVDPITGGYKTGYSTDGTHPIFAGIAAMAAEMASVLRNLSSYEPRPYLAAYSETAANQPGNLIRNGSFAQQTTPGTPDGWTASTVSGSRTVTADAPSPYTGKDYVYTKTAAGLESGAESTFNVTAGDVIVFSGFARVAGLTGSSTGVILGLSSNGPGLRVMNSWKQNGDFGFSSTYIPDLTGPAYVQLLPNDVGVYTLRNLTATNLTAQDAIWKPANGR